MGTVFETTDIEYAAHILSSSYGSLKIDGRGQHGAVRLAQAALSPSVRFDHNRFAMSFDTTGTRLDVLLIGHLRSGRVAYHVDGGERLYQPGDVYLAVPPGHPYAARSADTDVDLAVIDPALPGRLASAAPSRSGQPVQFTGSDPVSPRAARQWQATYAYVRDTVLTRPEANRQPLVAATASRLLVATALATFPNNAFTDTSAEDRRDGSPPTLRRAVAFIDENARRDITVADIAGAAHVTVRAVQLAFQRHMDTTPLGYLRQVRLEHARQDLAIADPGTQTVTAIAYRWGFTSSSRFAARYLQAYGVTPSHTLRQC
jgi:AraC-like DNA-binding protein